MDSDNDSYHSENEFYHPDEENENIVITSNDTSADEEMSTIQDLLKHKGGKILPDKVKSFLSFREYV